MVTIIPANLYSGLERSNEWVEKSRQFKKTAQERSQRSHPSLSSPAGAPMAQSSQKPESTEFCDMIQIEQPSWDWESREGGASGRSVDTAIFLSHQAHLELGMLESVE
jgi:hypothetical protein